MGGETSAEEFVIHQGNTKWTFVMNLRDYPIVNQQQKKRRSHKK